MAVEKDKVLAAIETKFKGKSISKTFKQNLAAKWAEKIDTDEDIDTYIEDREEIITEAISEADRRAVDAAKKASEKAKEAGKEPKEESKEVELPDDTPEYMKAFMKKFETMEAKLTSFEQAKSQESIATRFKSHEKVKGIPEFILKGYIPTKEEDFDSAVEELSSVYETFAKEQNLTKFGHDQPGGAGTKKAEGAKKEAPKEEIEAITAGMKLT